MHVRFSPFLKPKSIALIWEIGDKVTEYMVDLFLLEASSYKYLFFYKSIL